MDRLFLYRNPPASRAAGSLRNAVLNHQCKEEEKRYMRKILPNALYSKFTSPTPRKLRKPGFTVLVHHQSNTQVPICLFLSYFAGSRSLYLLVHPSDMGTSARTPLFALYSTAFASMIATKLVRAKRHNDSHLPKSTTRTISTSFCSLQLQAWSRTCLHGREILPPNHLWPPTFAQPPTSLLTQPYL